MSIRSFRDLDVWKLARELSLEVYREVRKFPEDERFCLSLQMRRAAISIGANIAEGFSRFGPKSSGASSTSAGVPPRNCGTSSSWPGISAL